MSQFPIRLHRLACFVLICLVPIAAWAQRGALTVARGLDQLTQQADLIVHGYVTSARVEPHPQLRNLMTVVISMSVEDTLKGASRKNLEFRQYIWDIRDQVDAASYKKGQELLLLLGPVSAHGLTSPVGLEQGRFRIARDSSGRAVAVNGRGNAGLFHSTAARARARGIKLSARPAAMVEQAQPGPADLADLKDTIRSFAGTK